MLQQYSEPVYKQNEDALNNCSNTIGDMHDNGNVLNRILVKILGGVV